MDRTELFANLLEKCNVEFIFELDLSTLIVKDTYQSRIKVELSFLKKHVGTLQLLFRPISL